MLVLVVGNGNGVDPDEDLAHNKGNSHPIRAKTGLR